MPACRCIDGGGGFETVWLSMPSCGCGGGSFGTAWLVFLIDHDTFTWLSTLSRRSGGGGFATAGSMTLTFGFSVSPLGYGGGGGGVEAVWLSMPLCWRGGGSFGTAWFVLHVGHDTTVCRSMPPYGGGGGGGGGFASGGPVSLTPHGTGGLMYDNDVVGGPDLCCFDASNTLTV